jgi:hypothetical protein
VALQDIYTDANADGSTLKVYRGDGNFEIALHGGSAVPPRPAR